MRPMNSLLNGITPARVTSERTEASHGPRLEAGWQAPVPVGLGSRLRADCTQSVPSVQFLAGMGRDHHIA